MKVFNVESVVLAHLVTGRYSYAPKDIRVEAIRVTTENVGALSLEFESELMWSEQTGAYFKILVERNENKDAAILIVQPGFWIVPLRGEIHMIDDYTFDNTFSDIELGDGSHKCPVCGGSTHDNFIKAAQSDYNEAMRQIELDRDSIRGDLSPANWHEKSIDKLIQSGSVGENAPEPTPAEMDRVAKVIRPLYKTDPMYGLTPNTRVRIKSTEDFGIVTVAGVDMGDGKLGVEVLLDATGQQYTFDPINLEIVYPEIGVEKRREP